MKAIIITAVITFFSISLHAQSLIGIWKTSTGNTKIEILQFDGGCVGKIKSSDNKKAEIGEIILKKLKKENVKWTGKLYAPKRKEWYDVDVFRKDNTLELKINVGYFGKTITWEKSK